METGGSGGFGAGQRAASTLQRFHHGSDRNAGRNSLAQRRQQRRKGLAEYVISSSS